MINKLRRKKTSDQCMLPAERDPAKTKTLVIDLDETLIYTNFRKPSKYDFSIEVELKGKMVTGYVSKRFGVEAFLFEMSKSYEIVIFSSSKRRYVDQVLEKLDPKKEWISYSFAREHCTIINQSYFIKPIRALGRDLKTIIAIDVFFYKCRIIGCQLL